MDGIKLDVFQKIFDMIPIGLGIASMEGKLLIFNQAILEPGGYTADDIHKLNSVAELYFDPADRAKVLGIAQNDGRVDNYRVRFKKKDGEAYYTLMSLRPVEFQDQRGWLATVLDIDDQVKSEQEVKSKLDEIQRLNEIMVGRELKMAELKEQLEKNTQTKPENTEKK